MAKGSMKVHILRHMNCVIERKSEICTLIDPFAISKLF